MKTLRGLLLVSCLTVSLAAQAAQTAQVHLTCLSLRVSPGSDGFGNTLALTSIASADNGELYPSSSGNYGSGITLDAIGFPVLGAMDVVMPDFVDENQNGFDDFFEVQQGVSTTFTSGFYETEFTEGSIVARWSRAPGSSFGTCVFNLIDDTFGNLGNFTHTFQVLEFVGYLTYTTGPSNITAVLDLAQTDNPAGTIQGPALFSKVVPGNHDFLVLRPGFWTNDSGFTLELEETDVFRDTLLKTNYYGFAAFVDGDPGTAGYDYPFWQLSIDDPNDSDGNTIPDFSDEPTSSAQQPLLALTRGSTNLWLSISGEIGRLHHVLHRTDLNTGNWQTNLTVTLTNSPQLISLPIPVQASRFWQVQVP